MIASKCKMCGKPAHARGLCLDHYGMPVRKRKPTEAQKRRAVLQSRAASKRPRKKFDERYVGKGDKRWALLAKQFLIDNAICDRCVIRGRIKPAEQVDHVRPYAKYESLRYLESNLQALCIGCHNTKEGFAVDGVYYDYRRRKRFVEKQKQ